MNPVEEKANGIHERGLEALRNDQVKPLVIKDMLASILDRFLVGGLVSYRSLSAEGNIPWLMENVARVSGIEFFAAGSHFPLHFTIGEGKASNREFSFAELKNDADIKQIGTLSLKGLIFDTLVLDKGNLLLTASTIPPEIIALREKLDEIYPRYGFQHLRIQDLLHMTIARITRFSDDQSERQQDLDRYVRLMEVLREEFRAEPAEIPHVNICCLPTVELLTARPPY